MREQTSRHDSDKSNLFILQGRVLGITIGCLLGMCPLLFMRGDEKTEKPTDVSVSASPEEEIVKVVEVTT